MCDDFDIAPALTARGVIGMIVREDHVGDGLVEFFCEFVFQPGDGFSVDRVGDHDAFVGDHEHGVVKIILETIDVAFDLLDRAIDVLGFYRRGNIQGQNRSKGRKAFLVGVHDDLPIIITPANYQFAI